jgi:hypothetical protein
VVVHLLGAVFQIRDQIGSVLRFLQAGENHLRPWNVLLRNRTPPIRIRVESQEIEEENSERKREESFC